jgi:hypothetical protein
MDKWNGVKTFLFWNLKSFISSSLEISKRACSITDSNSELHTAGDVGERKIGKCVTQNSVNLLASSHQLFFSAHPVRADRTSH